MFIHTYIFIYIYFCSSPVASCGGVSQASSPRSGNARLKIGKMSGRPMRPRHRVMPRARGPFPAPPALGSRTFYPRSPPGIHEFINAHLFTFGSDVNRRRGRVVEPRKLRTNMHSVTCYVHKQSCVNTRVCALSCTMHAHEGDQGKHSAGASAISLFSSPVASCGGVSQASSPRLCNAQSGSARLKREEERKANEA